MDKPQEQPTDWKDAWEFEKSFIDCEILANIYVLLDKLSYVPSEEMGLW